MPMLVCYNGYNHNHSPVLVREDCVAKVERNPNGTYSVFVTVAYNEDTGRPDGVDQYWTTEALLFEVFGQFMFDFTAPEVDWAVIN